MDLDKYYDQGVDLVMTHGPGLLLALITLFVGLRIISFVLKLVDKGFEKSKLILH